MRFQADFPPSEPSGRLASFTLKPRALCERLATCAGRGALAARRAEKEGSVPQLELEVEEDLVRKANEDRWGGRGASFC